jgi:hypothetical protein
MRENFFETMPQSPSPEEKKRGESNEAEQELYLDPASGKWVPLEENDAARRMLEKGPLALSADDYREMGATPPELGYGGSRAFIESMSREEIREWVEGLSQKISLFSGEDYKDDPFAQRLLPILRQQYESTLRTLRDAGMERDTARAEGE